MDDYHGQGGSYEVIDGKRVLKEKPTVSHADGDRPRDAKGKAIEEAAVPTQSAFPAPVRSPWLAAEPAAESAAATEGPPATEGPLQTEAPPPKTSRKGA